LTLSCVSLPEERVAERARRIAVAFFDFVIDGIPLRSELRTADIGVLSDNWDSGELARQFAGETSVDARLGGRALVYGCRECLDVDCGGIAVKIVGLGDRVRWNVLEQFWMDHEQGCFVFESTDVGPFEFDSTQYLSVLERFQR